MDLIAQEKIKMAVCKTFQELTQFLNFNDIEWKQEALIPKSSFPDHFNAFDMIKIQDEIIHFYRKIRDLTPDVHDDVSIISNYFDIDLPSLLQRYIILHHQYWKHSRENCLMFYQFIQTDFDDIPLIEDVNHFETLTEWRYHINHLMLTKYSHIFQIAHIDIHFLQSNEN